MLKLNSRKSYVCIRRKVLWSLLFSRLFDIYYVLSQSFQIKNAWNTSTENEWHLSWKITKFYLESSSFQQVWISRECGDNPTRVFLFPGRVLCTWSEVSRPGWKVGIYIYSKNHNLFQLLASKGILGCGYICCFLLWSLSYL